MIWYGVDQGNTVENSDILSLMWMQYLLLATWQQEHAGSQALLQLGLSVLCQLTQIDHNGHKQLLLW